MVQSCDIPTPRNNEDSEGALRAFHDFFKLYQPVFAKADKYLEHIMNHTNTVYAEAYRPWKKALRILANGIFLLTKRIPLPDKEEFLETLQMFSFESAARFLRDVCASAHMQLQRGWCDRFLIHINLLLFSFSILNRQHEHAAGR